MLDQKSVGIPDVLGQTHAESSTAEVVPPVRPHPPVVIDMLQHALGVPTGNRLGDLRHVGRADFSAGNLIRSVPRPVATDHESLQFRTSSEEKQESPLFYKRLRGQERTTYSTIRASGV